MKRWAARSALLAALGVSLSAATLDQQQAAGQPTVEAIREAAAAGRIEDAWNMVGRLPIELSTVELAVELALAPRLPTVAATRLPLLADRTARLSLTSPVPERQFTACAIILRTTTDAACVEQIAAATRGTSGAAVDRARLWAFRRLLGEQLTALPAGWESEIQGSSALEAATWPELPPASRVRLLEPLLNSRDPINAMSAMVAMQMVPGPEALAVWRRLATEGSLSFPGARTQITVGLARHGDAESLKTLSPHLGMLPVLDRLALALGRAERKQVSGINELVSLVNIGAEHESLQAAEALASVGATTTIERRVATWVRDGSPALRERWLLAAARLGVGGSSEVVRRLTSDDEGVRLAAALAVAVAAVNPRKPGR